MIENVEEKSIIEITDTDDQFEKLIQRTNQMVIDAEVDSYTRKKLLTNMNHKIRTDLNGILGFIDILLSTKLTNEQNKYIKLIKSNSYKLFIFLNNMIDLTKFEVDEIKLNDTIFNINSLIESVAEIMYQQLKEKNIKIHTLVQKNMMTNFIGDGERIKNILINFTDKIQTSSKAKDITIYIKSEKKYDDYSIISISIINSLYNLDEVQNYDDYQLIDPTTLNIKKGDNLSHIVTSKLIDLMGGKLWLDKTSGKWTDYHFNLQLKHDTQRANKHSITSLQNKDTVKILLVEDILVNRLLIKTIFNNIGIKIDCAEDGIQALEALKNHDYQLVFMDVQMPNMDGFTATKTIREQLKLKNLPIIAMTAQTMSEDKEKCFEVGMNDYISKPIDVKEVIEKTEKWLATYHENK